jgi:hypothetical protein
VVVAGLAATAVLATACQAVPPRGELGEDQQVLATCDPAAPPASFVQIDGTGSSASEAIITERMTAVEQIVRRTAICSGRLRVIVFSSSSSATAPLFDGPLHLDGATDNARLKRVPALVGTVMEQIKQAYGPAAAGLSNTGSDITAQYRLASEWTQQLGGTFRLHLYMFTDGFQNVGVDLISRALSAQEAADLAAQIAVPKLPGALVVVAGLGHVVGTPPPSNLVEGLVSFYDALCAKTAAAKCLSVTDYAVAGR